VPNKHWSHATAHPTVILHLLYKHTATSPHQRLRFHLHTLPLPTHPHLQPETPYVSPVLLKMTVTVGFGFKLSDEDSSCRVRTNTSSAKTEIHITINNKFGIELKSRSSATTARHRDLRAKSGLTLPADSRSDIAC
jgi:hypothetical protein